MAKRKTDYLDGFLEVASQIEDVRAGADRQEVEPSSPPAAIASEPQTESNGIAELNDSVSTVAQAAGADDDTSPRSRNAIRTKSIRAQTERSNFIRIGNERLYVVRSASGQVQGIDWRAMAPSLPKPTPLQDRYYPVDNEVDDLLMRDLDPAQQSIYRYLYRNAYGWGRCVCAASFESIQQGTGIKSRVTVQRAIDSLRDLGCISVVYEKSPVTPRVYRVYLPCEMKAYEGRSKRSETIRLEYIRLENDGPLVQKLNVSASENERIESERIAVIMASSCEEAATSDGENAPKYSTKDITKNSSSKRDDLLLLLQSNGFRVNAAKVDEWAADDTISLSDVEAYVKWVNGKASKGECDKPVPFLVSAVDGRWPVDTDAPPKPEPPQPAIVVDPKAQEDEAVRAHIDAMTPQEREALTEQALGIASGEWIYRRAKTQEARDGVIRSKMMDIVRKVLQEATAALD